MILFILTSHRHDCFSLCLECLERNTDLTRFTHIYIMANAPEAEHLAEAVDFASRYPHAKVAEFTPRGMAVAMAAQDNILAKHPGEVLVKIDEDVFVTPGWLDGLVEMYRAYRRQGCKLVSALVPNNDVGRALLHRNLCEDHPDYAATPDWHVEATSNCAGYAVWLWKSFCAGTLDFSYTGLRRGIKTQKFTQYLNINCILVDSKLLAAALPFVHGSDESNLNRALYQNEGWFGMVSVHSLAHHYSFRNQQQAVDAVVSPSMIRPMLLMY